ncbi:MAG: Rieske (2Fe-2S) protein [Cytophagales bacterium]|nr:Rieske (2Fe-2S) protein [Cytophagales bacterium]
MISRRHFVKITCTSCLGVPLLAGVVTGCQPTRYVTGTMEPNGISVMKQEFHIMKDSGITYREYVIVRNDSLEYPIALYRFSDQLYSALLMKCSHQGTELQAAGDHLHCPAHGSEFSSRGDVTSGPADKNLRTFRVSVDEERLLIELS